MTRVRAAIALLLLLACALPGRAQDRLIYCNHPEKIRGSGVVGDAWLEPQRTYTVFYHYRNVSGRTADFVVALRRGERGPLGIVVRRGIADPRRDPPTAGRQAMARLFENPERRLVAADGEARFVTRLRDRQVASGVLIVTAEERARLRLFFNNESKVAPGMRVVVVDSPRHDIEIPLRGSSRQIYRIGAAEDGVDRTRDGAYGSLYAFRIDAPEGQRVRVSFSPRGGKGGIVAALDGRLVQSGIVPAARRRVLASAVAGKDGLLLMTSPFGGVFYPVELVFERL